MNGNRLVIENLIPLFKNIKKKDEKIKIVCDWDEVIQALEPKAYYELSKEKKFFHEAPWQKIENEIGFENWFESFWMNPPIYYSEYGSHSVYSEKKSLEEYLKKDDLDIENYKYKNVKLQIDELKSHVDFYKNAPFLTIAEQLTELLDENIVEVIFLTAYDKDFFSEIDGDLRKKKIFANTFGEYKYCSLNLIGFRNGEEGEKKNEWIIKNVPDCDVVIDDNPKILNEIAKSNRGIMTIAPFYFAFESKHNSSVVLIKNSISNLNVIDFKWFSRMWQDKCLASLVHRGKVFKFLLYSIFYVILIIFSFKLFNFIYYLFDQSFFL